MKDDLIDAINASCNLISTVYSGDQINNWNNIFTNISSLAFSKLNIISELNNMLTYVNEQQYKTLMFNNLFNHYVDGVHSFINVSINKFQNVTSSVAQSKTQNVYSEIADGKFVMHKAIYILQMNLQLITYDMYSELQDLFNLLMEEKNLIGENLRFILSLVPDNIVIDVLSEFHDTYMSLHNASEDMVEWMQFIMQLTPKKILHILRKEIRVLIKSHAFDKDSHHGQAADVEYADSGNISTAQQEDVKMVMDILLGSQSSKVEDLNDVDSTKEDEMREQVQSLINAGMIDVKRLKYLKSLDKQDIKDEVYGNFKDVINFLINDKGLDAEQYENVLNADSNPELNAA